MAEEGRRKIPRRLSTGGKPPRKVLIVPHDKESPELRDHAGNAYSLANSSVWKPDAPSKSWCAKLGLQLYILGSREESERQTLAEALLNSDGIEGWGNARNWWPRIDAYSGFASIEECIEHHRKEKEFRRKAAEDMRRDEVAGLSDEAAKEKLTKEVRGREPLPHIVPTWCPSDAFWTDSCSWSGGSQNRYRSWIFVIREDQRIWDDVQDTGLLMVHFDLDVTPRMEVQTSEVDVDGRSSLGKGWVRVDWSRYRDAEPVHRKLLCVREGDGEGQTPDSDTTLFEAWSEKTLSLQQCCYQPKSCDPCDDGEEHEWCENDLDEHYFDEDGQCIGCRLDAEAATEDEDRE